MNCLMISRQSIVAVLPQLRIAARGTTGIITQNVIIPGVCGKTHAFGSTMKQSAFINKAFI
jgi:hypothetical protein